MKKLERKILIMAAVLLLLLAGCKENMGGDQLNSQTQGTEVTGPTAPPDGDPGNVTCKGSYSTAQALTSAEANAVVATLGSGKLTNAQLQVYYRMAVSSYSGATAPDWTQPLDVQLCPIDDTAATWQQYFLRQALSTWQSRQALALEADESRFSDGQKDYLSGLTELTNGNAALLDYALLLNQSYFYVIDQYEALRPTEEELQQRLSENPGDPAVSVDIRYIRLAPDSTDAQPILDAFLAAYGKEADFALLAGQYSLDAGTRRNGGLYTGLRQGWLIEELDAWCFDESRQTGDYTVIESEDAIHILYFRGKTDARPGDMETAVAHQRTDAALAEIMGKYPLSVDYAAIKLAPIGTYDLSDDDLLYPHTKQEQYPEIPRMIQQDYPYSYYGPGRTVSSHGCGLTCFAMVATYLLDEEQSPAVLGPQLAAYSAPEGTARSLFSEGPAMFGFGLAKQTMDDEEALSALRDGHVVISLQKRGLFTQGGHYIILAKYQEDGKITVLDPNKFNFVRNSIREDGFANGFEEKYITASAHTYWIYEKKMLNDPACTRCGGEGAAIFSESYYCDDCRPILSYRELFERYCG